MERIGPNEIRFALPALDRLALGTYRMSAPLMNGSLQVNAPEGALPEPLHVYCGPERIEFARLNRRLFNVVINRSFEDDSTGEYMSAEPHVVFADPVQELIFRPASLAPELHYSCSCCQEMSRHEQDARHRYWYLQTDGKIEINEPVREFRNFVSKIAEYAFLKQPKADSYAPHEVHGSLTYFLLRNHRVPVR